MSEFEVVLMGFLILLRVIVIVSAVSAPIILLVKMKSSIVVRSKKKTVLYVFGFLFSLMFLYSAFANIEVPARVDVESIKGQKDVLLSMEYGRYEFDTEYIEGRIYVNELNGFELCKRTETNNKIYEIDDDVICSVSSVLCEKDGRLSHIFEPTISSGTILIGSNNKAIEIYYFYNYENIASFIWPITNPEIFYRPKIDVGDILQTYIPMDQSD